MTRCVCRHRILAATAALWAAALCVAGEARGARWLVQRESVEPADVAEYQKSARELLEAVSAHPMYQVFAVRGEGPSFTYLATAPEASIADLWQLSRERARAVARRGLVAPDTQREWILSELPELSRLPESPPEHQEFFRLTFHYIRPGSEDAALRTARRWVDLRAGRGARFKAFHSEQESGQSIHLFVEGAPDRAAFFDRQQANSSLNRKGKNIERKLEKHLHKIEVIEGVILPEFSSSGRIGLARAIWSSAPSAERAPRLAPMEPLPPRVDAASDRVASDRVVPFEPLSAGAEIESASEGDVAQAIASLIAEPVVGPELPPLPDATVAVPAESASRAAIEALVHDWAAAWSEQRLADYLSFYAGDFRPPDGMSRRQWSKRRGERLSAPAFIQVTLSSVQVRVLDADKASAQFVQAYTSDSYNDIVTKLLGLIREGDGWRIQAETVLASEAD